jgi:hypothetical protein
MTTGALAAWLRLYVRSGPQEIDSPLGPLRPVLWMPEPAVYGGDTTFYIFLPPADWSPEQTAQLHDPANAGIAIQVRPRGAETDVTVRTEQSFARRYAIRLQAELSLAIPLQFTPLADPPKRKGRPPGTGRYRDAAELANAATAAIRALLLRDRRQRPSQEEVADALGLDRTRLAHLLAEWDLDWRALLTEGGWQG